MHFQGRTLAWMIPFSMTLGACSSIHEGAPVRNPASVMSRLHVDEVSVRSAWQDLRNLSGMSSGSSEADLQEVLLKALIQSYVKADQLLAELDREFDSGKTIEQLVHAAKGERKIYTEFLVLRSLKEGIEETLKQKASIQFNLALEMNAPRIGALDQFEAQVERLMESHPGQEALIGLALAEVRGHVREVREAYQEGRAPGAHREFATRIQDVRSVRKQIKGQGDEALKSFVPQDGESGIHVDRFLRKIRPAASEEISKVFSAPGRLPAAGALKIEPSTGPAGNITGSGFPKGVWALTYDDGPAKTTVSVLKNLSAHGMKASFFMLSQQIDTPKEFPEVAIREAAEGHDVASHSYSHPQVPKLGATQRTREIEGAAKVFQQVLGKRPDFFRLPYGAGVGIPSIRAEIAKACMVHVFWNVDTLDWHDKDPDLIYQRSVKQVESLGRGIILFHDIHSQSVVASEMLMRFLKSKGVRMVTLSEIVKEINGGESWSCKAGG